MIQKNFLRLIESIQKYQKECLMATIATIMLFFCVHQYRLYQHSRHKALSYSYFNIIHDEDYPNNHEAISAFIAKNPRGTYSDLLRLQLAKSAFDAKNYEQAEKHLHTIIKLTSAESLRSLAAYRLAHVIKTTQPEQALKQTEKITTKSMRGIKSLLKAELYSIMGDKAKAMIELDLVMSSQGQDNGDERLLIELAHQQKRYLLQE